MATPLTIPLLTAEGYYKRAWRIALRAQYPRWKEPILKRNLAYLWASRTPVEEAACEALRAAGSLMLPVIDLAIMPHRSVRRGWWPLRRGGGVAAPVPAQRVNTTSFAFWPQSGTHDAPIPNPEQGLENLFEAGTLLPASDPADGTWHGAKTLGEGGTGRVYLWLKTDADNRIVDRIAIKDAKPLHAGNWVNPTYWRDNLPKEIAIQQRLAAQGHAGITPFRGYRLNMGQRRYRQYFDYCDYQSLSDVMVAYYHLHGSKIQRRQRLKNPDIPAPATIPEPFLWYVFKSLVDALLTLRDGTNNPLPNNEPWKPILHLDLCLDNIFAAPRTTTDGTPIHPPYAQTHTSSQNEKIIPVAHRNHWPRILLADFDTALFTLQDTTNPASPDTYQDNPTHYLIGATPAPSTAPDSSSLQNGAAARYAPELFHTFYTQQPADAEVRPLATATDVWALGQVMWCLLGNLAYGGDFRPRWEGGMEAKGRVFVSDGKVYSRAELEDGMFRDDGVGGGYSGELKGLVRDCLQWEPRDRPGLEELGRRIEGAVGVEGQGKSGGGEREAELLMRVPGDVEKWLVGARWMGREDKLRHI